MQSGTGSAAAAPAPEAPAINLDEVPFGTRAQLESIPRNHVDVYLPEVKCKYRVTEMNGTERDKFEASTFKVDANGKRTLDSVFLRGRLCVLTLDDGAGKHLYEDNEARVLSEKLGAGVIDRLFAVAQELNGLKGTSVADAEKNSASVQSDASASASP